MPSTTQELADYWGGRDEGPAMRHLVNAGFKLTKGWEWIIPAPDYVLTDRDEKAIIFLIEEWDFGGWIHGT